jgi:hypothetical protein
MGLLAPGFLLGALAIGLPLYLHLLRRHASAPMPFSSLMLFEPQRPSSTHRRRLRYLVLLALRILLLLLLALAFAQPYVNRPAAAIGSSKLLLLVIDDSFSMRAGTRLADAKRAALGVLAAKPPLGRAQVLTLGAQAHVLTAATSDDAALRAAIEGIQPGDALGNFGALGGAVRAIAQSASQPIEVHLFSDLQRTNLPASFTEMALPDSAALLFHPMAPSAQPNWAVESVTAPAEVWNPRQTQVQAVIAGYGTPAAQRTVEFVVNGATIARRQVQVPAAGRATVTLDSFEVPYGFSRCSVRIDAADALPADDTFLFSLERADPRRGLFVHQSVDARSGVYFATALRAASDTAVVLDDVTVEHVSATDLTPYAFVVVSDVASLPAAFAARLTQYVQRGGGVLLALGTVAAQERHVPILNADILATRHYAQEAQAFASVGEADTAYPLVGTHDQWAGVKFFYASALDPADAHVVMRLADRTPLLLEKPLGEGHVVVFASGFDNLTNDLPLHPLFVAFVDRAVHYLSGHAGRRSSRVVDEFLELRQGQQQAVGVEVVEPSGRQAFSFEEAASVRSYQLRQTGFYDVRLANGQRDLIAVNADRRESDLATIPADVLALWRGPEHPATRAQVAATGATPAVLPQSLWWYAMLLVLFAALVESAVASRHLGPLAEEP